MNEMKNLLLEILENVFKTPDITATQQMGVQLSNAVKREGVVIIQNQNVEVLSHIVPLITKGIRLCDEQSITITQEPKEEILEIEAPGVESLNPLEDVCKYFYQRETKWQDMQDTMKTHYMQYVISKFQTKKKAAEFLDIQTTYLCKLTKEVE